MRLEDPWRPERYAGPAVGRGSRRICSGTGRASRTATRSSPKAAMPCSSISATRCRPDSVRSPSGVRVDPSSGRSRRCEREHGVDRIEAVIPTHYHDDHVAGLTCCARSRALRSGRPRTSPRFSSIRTASTCPASGTSRSRSTACSRSSEPFTWHEYELTLHALPGHTLYAAAIEFQVDGKRVLAIGDQQTTGVRPAAGRSSTTSIATVSASATTGAAPSSTGACDPIADQRPLAAAGSERRVSRPARAEAAGSMSSTASCCRRRTISAPRASAPGSSRTGRARRAGDTLELDVTVRNPFDRPERATVAPRRARRLAGAACSRLELERARRGRRALRVGSRRVRAGGPGSHRSRPDGRRHVVRPAGGGAGGRRVSIAVEEPGSCSKLPRRASRHAFACRRGDVADAAPTRRARHGRRRRRDAVRRGARARRRPDRDRAALDAVGAGRRHDRMHRHAARDPGMRSPARAVSPTLTCSRCARSCRTDATGLLPSGYAVGRVTSCSARIPHVRRASDRV